MKRFLTSLVLAMFLIAQTTQSAVAVLTPNPDGSLPNVAPAVALTTPSQNHQFQFAEVAGPNKTIDLSWQATDENVGDTLLQEVYVSTGSTLFSPENKVATLTTSDLNAQHFTYDAEGAKAQVSYTWGVRVSDDYDLADQAIGTFTVAAQPDGNATPNVAPTVSLISPTVTPPEEFSSDSVLGVDNGVTLTWLAADQNIGDTLQQEIFLTTDQSKVFDPTTKKGEIISRNPGDMKYFFDAEPDATGDITYYWGIRVSDDYNLTDARSGSFVVKQKVILPPASLVPTLQISDINDKTQNVTNFYPYDTVWFQTGVKNLTAGPGTMSFSTDKRFDILVKDLQGNVVWNYDFGKTFANVTSSIDVAGNANLNLYQFQWDLTGNNGAKVPAGTYNVALVYYADNQLTLAPEMPLVVLPTASTNTAPIITLNSPSDQFSTAGQTVSFSYTIVDESAATTSQLCYTQLPLNLPGLPTGPFQEQCKYSSTGTGTRMVDFDFTGYTKPAKFMWSVTADEQDTLEKYSKTSTVREFYLSAVTSSNLAPTLSLIAPTDAALNLSVPAALTWTASDPENDAFTTDVYVASGTSANLFASANKTTISPSIFQFTPNISRGQVYYWAVVVTENATGRAVTSPVRSFSTQANRQPVITLATTSPADITPTTITVRWNVTDPDGDPTHVTLCYGTDGDVINLISQSNGDICVL